ncbi:efflux RND transporter periplasmic adaptor subunit [Limnoraphis robusta]|uniref:efflux RND transporter periplasmic adaptor subunit n=1 Tax=Limnoraphis robusta TaxID=1118279 RepID=UPI002B218AA0|nr:biotin/lipoyl-binding protein [Limnoraphis robusta]MEA5500317.1 biotin/lipoyl-binding protein [Limnoraphis robusta BA-68 BA1]
MNSTPKNSSQPRLKVVPPTVPEQPKPQDKPVQPPVEQTPQPSTFPSQWITWGVVLLGLGGIGMIPVNHSISGSTIITSTVGERQSVTMPEAGTLTLYVRSNQTVKPGDLLATVSSSSLENQKAATEQKISEAKTAVNGAEQKLIIAQTRLEVSQTLEGIAVEQRNRKQEEVNQAKLSSGVARIRAIQQEQAGIESEIKGIENEIKGLENEKAGLENERVGIEKSIERLKQQLEIAELALEKREGLVLDGIMGAASQDLINWQIKVSELTNQIEQQENSLETHQQKIAQKQNQIWKTEQLINQRQQQIGAKTEGVNEIIEGLEKQLEEAVSLVEQKIVERISTQREVEAVLTEIADKIYLLSQQEGELKRLEGQEGKLRIESTVLGTITTPDLDLIQNRTLEAGKEVLTIVNLSRLTGLVEIQQEEIDLIHQNLPVIFKPRQATVHQYQAKIEDIQPVIQSDPSGQNSVLQIRITIDNDDQQLQPGLEGVAHIKTPSLRVYQKVSREFLKLFPWWKL